MKELEKTIIGKGEVKGITFTQVKHSGNVYLYKRSDGYFETFTAIEQRGCIRKIKGVEIAFEEKHIYPSGESWNGICVKRYDRALERFNELLTAQKLP